MPLWTIRRFPIEQDLHLNLRERRTGGRTTCILLHGTAEGAYVWSEFVKALPEDLDVIAVDLRGHGDSDWDPRGRYVFETHVGDVLKVIRRSTEGRLLLVGHSLGAGVATFLAPGLSQKLDGLVLVDSGPGYDPQMIASVAAAFRKMYRDYESLDEYVELLQENRILASDAMLRDLAQHALAETASRKYRPKYDPAVIDLLENHRDDSWWIPSARAVMAPTLLVRGQASGVLTPRTAETLLKSFRTGRLAVVPDAGHAVMTDNPKGFSAAVVPFIKSIVQTAV